MTNILKQDDWDEPEEFDTAFFKGYREVNHALAYRDLALFDWLVNEIHMSSCHDESGTYIFRTRQQIREEFRDLSQRQLDGILQSLKDAGLIRTVKRQYGMNLYLNPNWKTLIHSRRTQYESEHPAASVSTRRSAQKSVKRHTSPKPSGEVFQNEYTRNGGHQTAQNFQNVDTELFQNVNTIPIKETNVEEQTDVEEEAKKQTKGRLDLDQTYLGHSYSDNLEPKNSELYVLTESLAEPEQRQPAPPETAKESSEPGNISQEEPEGTHQNRDHLPTIPDFCDEPDDPEQSDYRNREPEPDPPAEKAPSSWKPETFCGEGPEADGEPICSRRMTDPPEDNWAVEPEEPFPEDESWKFRDPWETGTGGEDDPPDPEPRDADESDPAPEIRPEPKPAGFQPQDPVPDRNPEPHPPRVSPSPSSFLQSRHRSPAKPVYNFAELLQGDHAPSRAKIEALDRKIEDERRRKEEQTAGTAGSDSEPETIPAEPDVSGDPAGEAPPEADQPEKKPQFDFWSLLDDEHRKAAQRDKLAPDVRERLEWQDEAREAQKAEDEEYWTYVEHGGGEDDSPPGPERQSRAPDGPFPSQGPGNSSY